LGERPELGPQVRALGTTGLFVLPSTSPANAAVPHDERLRWFRALHEWLEAPERPAVRALVLDPAERVLLVKFVHPVSGEHWWATPGGGVLDGESDEDALRRELLEEAGLAGVEFGPLVWQRAHDFAWLGRLLRQRERIYLVRSGDHEPAPTIDLVPEAIHEVRWWTLDELDASGERFSPSTLAVRLRELLRNGPAEEPVDVGE
jgi:8-oxo-dGTP pyrophosphatase MutT (NUDIX family)